MMILLSYMKHHWREAEMSDKLQKMENLKELYYKETTTRVHELASIAIDQKQSYKDLQKKDRLAEEECERYKKMFSEERGKSIALYNRNKRYEQALEFGIKYLQASDIGQVQIVVQVMKEALGDGKNE